MRTVYKLAPYLFDFTPDGTPEARIWPELDDKGYTYHPQPIETYLILWRLTRNPKYRKWGSEILDRMIEKFRNADRDIMYWGVLIMGTKSILSPFDRDVYSGGLYNDDRVQQNHVLAETFKVSLYFV